jgi:hypothetical protein
LVWVTTFSTQLRGGISLLRSGAFNTAIAAKNTALLFIRRQYLRTSRALKVPHFLALRHTFRYFKTAVRALHN